jgi:hypothetical protein
MYAPEFSSNSEGIRLLIDWNHRNHKISTELVIGNI